MEVIIKVNNQSNGRDKLARLIQYTSRLLWHQLEKRNANKYSVDRIKNLEQTFSSFRKSHKRGLPKRKKAWVGREYSTNLFGRSASYNYDRTSLTVLRLGRCIDTCYTALNSINIEDPFLKLTLTVSKLAHSLYLYADHIVWLTKSGFLKSDSDNWNRTANKFWLLSIIANLARDFYEIIHLLQLHNSKFLKPSELLNGSVRNIDIHANFKHVYWLVNCHKDVFIDTVKNSCDLFIPLTALGFTKLSPSAVGVLGAASSLAALITIVKPITKLVPA